MSETPCSPSTGCCSPTRRDFLRFTGLTTAALLTPRAFAGPFSANANAGLGLDSKHPVPLDKKLSASWLASLTARGKPSAWQDWAALEHIGMPVAGIGTGTVYVGGDGRLWGWDIFNVPHEGCIPNGGTKDEPMRERDGANYLNPSKMVSPWNIRQGLVLHIDGKPKSLDHQGFPQVKFTGQYPIATIQLQDPACPISVEMETFSPFIPLDYDNSSLPVTIIEITLKNSAATAASVGLEAFLENAALRYDPSTTAAELRRVAKVLPLPAGAMVMGAITHPAGQPDSTPKLENLRDWGSMALAILSDKAQAQASRGKPTATAETQLTEVQEMAVRVPLTIPANGEIKTTVMVSWHFPGLHPEMAGMPEPRRWVGERFADAAAVVTYTAKEMAHLSGLTRSFRDTWYGSETGEDRGTLPHWLLERSLWTVSTLTTNGTYRMSKGRVWGWEGTGCCPGTCTHVWHYGQTAGRLFPQLEIDLRERTDFTPEVMTAAGNIKFRGTFIHDVECIDGQAGILLRCYREHLSDPTGEFLKRNWPHIQKATEFLVTAEAKDKPGGNDGIFTRRFENTLDAKWGGEIPWIVGIYLAGLTAAAAMAEESGDSALASRWREIVAKGTTAYAGYFDKSAGFYKAKVTEAELLPVHVGPGSHIDMCLGDFWLAQVGLPPIGDKAQLRQAMTSLFNYNFVPDMGVFRGKMKPHSGRHYALAGEGGLVMATWPHGGLPEACKSFPTFDYFQECMSGFEHAAAALMISLAENEQDSLLSHGLTVCRAIHDRYDAAHRNPYNEIECSDHYARAMSSYGVFISATGFHCHAASGLVRFEPKMGAKNFAAPFVGAGAWGRFMQKQTATGLAASLGVRFGSLLLTRLELRPTPTKATPISTVTLAGKTLAHRVEIQDGRLAILLAEPITLTPGQTLKITA